MYIIVDPILWHPETPLVISNKVLDNTRVFQGSEMGNLCCVWGKGAWEADLWKCDEDGGEHSMGIRPLGRSGNMTMKAVAEDPRRLWNSTFFHHNFREFTGWWFGTFYIFPDIIPID